MSRHQKQRLVVGLEALSLLAVAMLVRIADLDHAPIHDELQHLLAARSWAEYGSFAIADGAYDRGAIYTMLLAIVYSGFDYSVGAARMLSVALGSMTVVLLFLWARIQIDRTTAWVAALLLCFSPSAIFLSQYIRFYALHGLLFLLATIVFYQIIERLRGRELVLPVIVLVLTLSVAAHLQFITLIGCVGMAAYACYRLAPGIIERVATGAGYRRMAWLCAVGLVFAIGASFVLGIPQKLWEIYRWAPLWSSGGGMLRYHWMMVAQYPLLWATIPVASIVVFSKKSLPGIYCACLFGIAILLHSFAGMKAERFIYYVLPFFFVLSAILLKSLVPFLRRHLDSLAASVRPGSADAVRVVRGVGFIATVVFLVVSNPATRATADILQGEKDRGTGSHWSRYSTDWAGARDELATFVRDSDVVLTTQGLHLLYYFDRLDLELSASRLSDLYAGKWDQSKEFAVDPRTGHPVISSLASFQRVRSCFANGIVLVHSNAWRNPVYVSDDVADAIVQNAVPLLSAEDHGIHAYRWDSIVSGPRQDCANLRVIGQGLMQ